MKTRWSFVAAAALGAAPCLAQERPAQPPPAQPPPVQERPITQERERTTEVRTATDDFAMARRWQKATDLVGKKVVNESNEDLGKLEDIVIDMNSGRILYGVLSFGGFLGVGDKLFAIPWESLRLPDDAKNLVLPVAKDRLKNAEGFDKSRWPNFADETWAMKTYKYYDRTPYWKTDTGSIEQKARGPGGTYRDRWYERVTVWQKATDLCGKDAHNTKNEDIGRISDLAIDPDAGRVLYGVLAYNTKLYAVPASALTLSNDGKKFVINVSKEELNNMPSFTSTNWPNMTDRQWATRTHEQFRVEPYWNEPRIERQNNP